MPQINDHCEIIVGADQFEMTTKTNGDILIIRGIDLSNEQAASLAWLINLADGEKLKVEIKANI